MTLKKYTKHFVFIAALAGMAIGFSRCSAPSSGGSSATTPTTFSISGSIDVGSLSSSLSAQQVAAAKASASSAGDVNALATQCSDAYYYKVYCVSYSEPPAAAEGAVSCNGGSSGSFTVSGLPLDAEIGCFVRRSSTDTGTYSTLATIEIPTTSLSGETSSIVSQGDLDLAITLNNDGSITTVVNSGGDKLESPIDNAGNVDPAQYTGFWSIECSDSTGNTELFDAVACKCRNGGQQAAAYQPGGAKNPNPSPINPEDACENDNAAEVTAGMTQQFIELNMYTATPNAPITTGDGGPTIPAGTVVPVISVWSAVSATTSARAGGGEGADSVVEGVSLTWSTTQVTNAIAWTNTAQTVDGQTIDFAAINLGSNPMPTAASTTAAQWKNWAKEVFVDYGVANFDCTWGPNDNGVSETNDAGCISEFMDRKLRENRSLNLPVVRLDRMCGNMGCDGNLANAFVQVEGYHGEFGSVSAGTSTDSVVMTREGITPKLKNRYVFEPFEPTPTGGGFTQHEYYNRGWSCDDTGGDVQDPFCNGDHAHLNCGIREEMAIRFAPTSATEMKLFFESRSSVNWAQLEKWASGTRTQAPFATAMALCEAEAAGEEARFQMTATKQ